jgi:hypothetical protein
MQVKLTYQNEIKKLRKPNDYESLKSQAMKAFADLPKDFKFFYIDSDGDTISISNQDDFEEAIDYCASSNIQILKLVIA